MPKTRFDAYRKSADPPIDWLLAAILERQTMRKLDLKHMAEIAGVGYEYMRKLIRKPTTEWPHGALSNVCREFNIKLTPSVMGSTPESVVHDERFS